MKNAICGALITTAIVAAQQLAAPNAFETASVKPVRLHEGFNPSYKRATPVRVEYRNYTLARLIADAYGLAEYQIHAERWLTQERFEITARKPGHTPAAETPRMLQSLLIERFHLKTHREKREMNVYHLLPEKITLLRPEHNEAEVPGCKSFGTLAEFAQMVSRNLNAPVIDKTNIPGSFYFILAYSSTMAARELSPGAAPPPPPAPPPCPGWSAATMPPLANDIFEAARRQMGLRIERKGRTSVEVLVVDHADKVPEID